MNKIASFNKAGVFTSVFFLVFIFTFQYFKYSQLSKSQDFVCSSLKDEFIDGLSDSEYEDCLVQLSFFDNVKTWKTNLSDWMIQFGYSHLDVYEPAKTDEMWSGVFKEVGAKFRYVEDKWIVKDRTEESSFEYGDWVQELNGRSDFSGMDLLSEGGKYKVSRKGISLMLEESIHEVLWDQSVRLIELTEGLQILKVPSFRKDFFVDNQLNKVFKTMNHNRDLLLDMRMNKGGNVGAMMELANYLFCDSVSLGKIERKADSIKKYINFPQILDDILQLEFLAKNPKITLKVFPQKNCFNGDLHVLVDQNSNSVTEFLAATIKEKKRGLVYGRPTPGKSILAKYQPLPGLPTGYMFSYPLANLKTAEGHLIEGFGVYPDIELSYIQAVELEGYDSWVKQVLEAIK